LLLGTPSAKARLLVHARSVGLSVGLVAAVCIFAAVVGASYPLTKWLFFRYAILWGWCALFAVACATFGDLVLRRVFRTRDLPAREHATLAFALGVLAFFTLVFLGGLAHLLVPAFAVALPLVMIAAGARDLLPRLRRAARHLRALRARPRSWPPLLHLAAIVFGFGGIALVYFTILSPRNIAFDATMYHLGIAQEYAVSHAIRATPEAWTPAALPHLASVLYAWSFSLPGQAMFDRVECAQHLEFTLFLYTLASLPVLVRWLAPGARAGASWAAVFLFPGIFLYDSSLAGTADHVAAIWAVPIYLALRRAWQEPTRHAALFAAMAAGAMLTKYQSIYLVAGPAIAFVAHVVWLAARTAIQKRKGGAPTPALEPRDALLALGTAAAAGAILSAPHWLKNWIWYGDPLFPLLHRWFHPTRWVPNTGELFDDWTAFQVKDWVPHGTTFEKLRQTLGTLVTFSFRPHDWSKFHGKWPVFGSLFTLSLLVLPFVRGAKRTWGVVAAAHLGVFIWFWTLHQDRYLQVILPWMAAVVAATIALAWRTSGPTRWLIALLVALQIVWGGDVYFIPAHAMTQASPARTTSDLLVQGYKKQYDERLDIGGGLFQMGRAKELPADAHVLIHGVNARLGVWRPVVNDVAGWQYGVRYELLKSPGELHDKLRSFGVTHIAAHAQHEDHDALGADLRFFDYLEQEATKIHAFSDYTLYRLADERPAATPNDLVLYLGCSKYYGRGLQPLSALSVREQQAHNARKRKPVEPLGADANASAAALLARADYVVTDSSCKDPVTAPSLGAFAKLASGKGEELWARRRAH
jgi:hypothetical protein